MRVEPYTYQSGLQGVRIVVENAYSPWVLTLHQARELYTKLTRVLEDINTEQFLERQREAW